MKGVIVFTIFAILSTSIIFNQVDALMQIGGPQELEISPGETKTFEWGLISSEDDQTITLGMSTSGWGSQFITLEKSLELGPRETKYIIITVTIPDDHPGGTIINPDIEATQFGEAIGATVINVKAIKKTVISILQNENEEYRSNTAYDPPETVTTSMVEETEEMETMEEEKSETTEAGSMQITSTEEEQTQEEGGGCLIATAAFGSEMAQQVQSLRELRDSNLLSTSSGTAFMSGFNTLYYSFSPAIADLERENPMFREAVKLTITPLLTSLSILNYVDMDSEAEVLGYGISLILLNTAMYFVAPAIVITKLRKRF